MSMETRSLDAPIPVKNDKKKILCGGCEGELEADHPGIQCVQGHHYCSDCSKNIVHLFFSDPQHYTPVRCVQCHIELNASVFERQLTPEQFLFYQKHMLILVWAKELLADDERLDNCPFCPYAVIRRIDDLNFLYCKNPECEITSCTVCRKACPKPRDDYALEEEVNEIEQHFICAALANDKRIFDEHLESGQKVCCPNCDLAGMKDDACTHMTCPTCSQLWCYFCGKKVEDCDQTRGGTNGIFDHNHNWPHNPRRCPMYLTQIQDIDDRWGADEEQCLAFFHRKRSLGLLRKAYNLLGPECIEKLDQHFNLIRACGFTLDEILHEDLTLIKYPDRL